MKEQELMTATLVCGAAIGANLFVKMYDNDTVVVCATAGEAALGVNRYAKTAGQQSDISISGIVLVKAGDTITRMDQVTTNSSGKAITAATGQIVNGVALESAVANDLVHVLVHPAISKTEPLLATGVYQDLHEASSTRNYPLDTPRDEANGDRYRYGYGLGQHYPAFGSWNDNKVTISHDAPAQTATGLGAIGSTLVKVTVDSNDGAAANGAVAADELVGGRIVINNGGGGELLVQNRVITANTLIAAGGGTITVTLDKPLTAACTVSTSYIEIMGNRFARTRSGLATAAGGYGSFVGVPYVALLNQYGWFKTRGGLWLCPPSPGGTAPGYTANDREVYFAANGSIVGAASGTVIESGFQHAGYVLENSADGAGPPFVQLQLE